MRAFIPQRSVTAGTITLTLPPETQALRGTLDCGLVCDLLQASLEALGAGDSLSLEELLSEALARVVLHRQPPV